MGFGEGRPEERERRKCGGVCVCVPRVHVSLSLALHLLSQKALSEGEFASRRFFVCCLWLHQGAVQARMRSGMGPCMRVHSGSVYWWGMGPSVVPGCVSTSNA